MSNLHVGARVMRKPFRDEEPLYGNITQVYNGVPSNTGKTEEMYEVLWDGRVEPSRGYLETGLIHFGVDSVTGLLGPT